MAFEEVWNQLLRKSPKLEKSEATVTITSDNLKQLLRQTYGQGVKSQNSSTFDPFKGLFK